MENDTKSEDEVKEEQTKSEDEVKEEQTKSEEYDPEREEDEVKEVEEEDEAEDAGLDSEFAAFMSEVDALPKASAKRRVRSAIHNFGENGAPAPLVLGTSSEEVLRLTSKPFSNAYEVLLLPANASDDDIKKNYRKISLLIHPDKCKHPNAQDAFQVITKAYEELQKPEYKEKYQKVIAEATKRVMKNLAKENKRRMQAKETQLPTDEASIRDDVRLMCDKLLEELESRREYADRVRKANERYEKEQEEKLAEEEKKKMDDLKKWRAEQESRVSDWRNFKEDVNSKRMKVAAFQPLRHKKEERLRSDPNIAKKPMGIDESYKANWR